MSKSITIALSNSARAVVDHATRAERIVYSTFISDHGVTLDTVGEHVAALAELAIDMKRIAADDKAEIKRFKNKIRNGLNTHLGKVVPSKSADTEHLLTGNGVNVLAELSNDELLTLIRAEIANRSK